MHYRTETVESGAFILAGTGVFGSVLAILKNALLAGRFGASQELDVYFAAFRVPDFFYNVFIFGALTAGFLPVLSRWLSEGREKAWQLVSGLLFVFTIFLGVAAIAVFLFAQPLTNFLVPGFSTEAAQNVASLLRILMLQPILLSVSNVLSSTLQVFRRFLIYSLAPIFYNIGIILGIVWLSNYWGIWGVAWGVVLGALLHFFVQIPTFRSLGFSFSWKVRESLPGLKEVLFLMAPRALTLAAGQINLVILTVIASLLPVGTLAIFNFADALQGVPLSLLVMSFVTAAFPSLTDLWAKGSYDTFRRLFAKTLSEILLWTVPAALIFFAFRGPIVELTLTYGNFSAEAHAKTVVAFSVFIVSLPIQGLRLLLLRAFFASGDTKTPLLSYLIALAATISSAYFLSQRWGAAGLAAGLVLGSAIDGAILLFVLQRRLGELYLHLVSRVCIRSALIGGIGAFAGFISFWATRFFITEETMWWLFLRTAIACIPVAIVLFVGVLMYKLLDLRRFAGEVFEESAHGTESHP